MIGEAIIEMSQTLSGFFLYLCAVKRPGIPILTYIISGTLMLIMGYGCRTAPTASQIQKTYPIGIHANRTAYQQARQTYVQRDSALSFDADVVLSAQEEEVNRRLVALQHRMIQQYQQQRFFPPSHYFYRSKRLMEQTQLFRILRKMPKGGVLHLHPGRRATCGG